MWQLFLSAGAQLGGALLQSNAAERAKDQQIHASMQAAQQAAQTGQAAREVYAPFLQSGYGATNALTGRLGLPTQGVQQATNQASADYTAYVNANPDLAAAARRAVDSGQAPSLEAFGRQHYAEYGQSEGRELPGAQQAPAQPNAMQPQAMSADQPAPQNGNALTGGATPGASPGTYGTQNAPAYETPSFSYGIDDYESSPGYQFRMDQALGQVEGRAAAQGALFSGATLKGLSDRAQQVAYGDFAQERGYARGVYQDDRNFGRGVYQDDRNYLTGRYDRYTDDLYRQQNVGMQAGNATGNAILGEGAGVVQSIQSQGDQRAGNALTQGNIWSGLAGSLGGAAAGYLNGRRDPLAGLY